LLLADHGVHRAGGDGCADTECRKSFGAFLH
jgi:hypothetical protein